MDNFEYSREVNKGLDSIYVKYPKMRRGIAQDREIFEVCNQFAGREVVPDANLYALALANPPAYPVDEPKVALNYRSGTQQRDVQEAVAAIDQRNREDWVRDILPRFDVRDWESNFGMAVEFSNGELTLQKFEFLVQNPPRRFKLWFGDERPELLTKIRERLYDRTGRRMTALDIKSLMLNKY